MSGSSGSAHAGPSPAGSGPAADVGAEATGRPLRVLLVANTLPPDDVSGVGEQVLQLAAGLRAAGCAVEVLGRRGSGRPGAAGAKLLFPLTVVPAVAAALRRVRPDVVQVHESDGGLAALWVRLARGRRDRPLLAALLQVSYREERRAVRPLVAPDGRVLGRPGAVERRFRRWKAPLHVALGRLTVRLADRVLAPSAATAAEIERDYGVRDVAVVPNATGGRRPAHASPRRPHAAPDEPHVDPDERLAQVETGRRPSDVQPGEGPPDVIPSRRSQASGRSDRPVEPAAAGGPERPPTLLFVGRFRIRKGVEVLLEALAGVPATGEGPPGGAPAGEDGSRAGAVRLAIAGDGEHRAALETKVRDLRVGDRVDFLGTRSAAQVRDLLAAARALVVPSTYEGMPLVVLEAMEAGVPVVASRVSGIPEVVVDGETGWLVPPEDPQALAAALREVLADPAEAARRGLAGRRRLDERYRPAHAAAAWLAAVGADAARAR